MTLAHNCLKIYFYSLKESSDNVQTPESSTTALSELSRKLNILKDQNDQLEIEKYMLNQQVLNLTSDIPGKNFITDIRLSMNRIQ